MRRSILFVSLFFFSVALNAQAATFTVDSTTDTADANAGNGTCADASNNCSLRAAIQEANALAGADTITVPAGTFTLSSGALGITTDITLNGASAATTIIDADGNSEVMTVGSSSTVALSDVQLTGASSSDDGGALVITSATVTLTDAQISDNTITGNESEGAGIYSYYSTLTINRSLISGNTATVGGGLAIECGTTSITNTTIAENTARGYLGLDGGAMYFQSTGGGECPNDTADVTITHSTIANNVSNSDQPSTGGLYVQQLWDTRPQVYVKNTIFADNTYNCFTSNADIISRGYNIDDDGTCETLVLPTDQNYEEAELSAAGLADNGGPTATIALADGSLAIGNGTCEDHNGDTISVDQRGFSRPQGDACDIGAFESRASDEGGTTTGDSTITAESVEGLSNNRARVTYSDDTTFTFTLFPRGRGVPRVTLNSDSDLIVGVKKNGTEMRVMDALSGRLYDVIFLHPKKHKRVKLRVNDLRSDDTDEVIVVSKRKKKLSVVGVSLDAENHLLKRTTKRKRIKAKRFSVRVNTTKKRVVIRSRKGKPLARYRITRAARLKKVN